MADATPHDGGSPDVFATGRFPISPGTHDQGLRWLFDLSTVLMLLDCRPGDRVLDLGAGSGFSSEMLARFGYTVIAVDPDGRALANNRRRPSFDASRIDGRVVVAQGVAEQLPIADRSLDGVVAMNVLHHVPDLPATIAEFDRVLKPGGRVVFCEPGLDHLTANETQRARVEHGEDDQPFDVLAFLRQALDAGYAHAMLSATVQSPLRLLPLQEVEMFRSGRHPRLHMNDAGVLEELHRRHAYGMLQVAGEKPRTSRQPGRLSAVIDVRGVPRAVPAGGRFTMAMTSTNTGDTTWLARPSRFGGYVTFGCKLLAPDGRLLDDLLGRTPLAIDVAPGATAAATLDVPLPPAIGPGRYRLRFDMVDELICWFSDVGSTPVDVELEISSAG